MSAAFGLNESLPPEDVDWLVLTGPTIDRAFVDQPPAQAVRKGEGAHRD